MAQRLLRASDSPAPGCASRLHAAWWSAPRRGDAVIAEAVGNYGGFTPPGGVRHTGRRVTDSALSRGQRRVALPRQKRPAPPPSLILSGV